MQGSNHFMKLI